MKTVKVKVFKINELEEDARQKAIEDYREYDIYPFYEDNTNSLKKFADIFPVKIGNWEYGYRNYINFTMTCEDHISELTGQRLATYIWNNYREIWKGKYYSSQTVPTGRTSPPMINYKYRHSKVLLEECCNLTGYCVDLDLLQPIFDFCKKPDSRTFENLMNDCLNDWITVCKNDYEATKEDDYIIEEMEANEYLFTKDGKQFNRFLQFTEDFQIVN